MALRFDDKNVSVENNPKVAKDKKKDKKKKRSDSSSSSSAVFVGPTRDSTTGRNRKPLDMPKRMIPNHNL